MFLQVCHHDIRPLSALTQLTLSELEALCVDDSGLIAIRQLFSFLASIAYLVIGMVPAVKVVSHLP